MEQNKNQNNTQECPKDWQKWVQFPQKKREPHCGLTRGTAYNLAKKGLIKSASVRCEVGRKRGIRLFWLPSIYDYLQAVAKETAEREVLNNETEE